MASMAKTINNNHSVNISINHLHEITTQQQTAINSIQATLVTQQNDIDNIKTTIVDIRTSINHIIRSVSEIATKLGFEITLPSPLPLSSAPPTPLPAADENPTTLAPLSPMFCTAPPSWLAAAAPPIPPPVNAASFITPSFPLDATGNNALTLPSNLARHFSFAEIESTTNQLYEVLFLGVGKFEQNSGAVLFMVLGARPTINPTWPNEQEMADAHNMFVEMKQPICESNVLIFDPGGTLNIESIFDLEDKVDFEGSVMIRINDSHPTQHEGSTTVSTRPPKTLCVPRRFLEKCIANGACKLR